MPLLSIGLHKAVGRRTGASVTSPGLMKTQIMTGIFFWAIRLSITFERGVVAIAMNVTAAVLKDHQCRWNLWIVASRDVHPVLALHPVIDLAGVYELFRELA